MIPRRTLGPLSMLRRAAKIAVASTFALAACFPLPEASSATPPRPAISAVRTVLVSDIRDSAFFVSWVSEQPEIGAVRWGAVGSPPGTRVADVRGDVASTVHLVKVTGLNASTAYVFDVVSGATVDDQGGQHYRVTTGPTLPISQSDSIYGRILVGGNAPARNVLVTITVRAGDGTAAAPMVALIGPNDDGYWTSNLGNARAANGLTWFTGLANARVEVSADGGDQGKASASLDLGAARSGTSLAKLDGKAPAPAANVPTPTPVSASTPTSSTGGSTSLPAGGAPGPTGGASSGGATGRPIVVAPGTIALPSLPDGSSLLPKAALDAASTMPGFPAGPAFGAVPSSASRPIQSAPAPPIAPRGVALIDPSGTTVVRVVGVGDAAVTIDPAARAKLEGTGVASMSVAFDAQPPIENEVQAGSLGGGVVVPAGRPIDLRLELRDASGNAVLPTDDATTVEVTLPVLPVTVGTEGTFAWLVATYDAGGFAGYERPPALFDPSTNRTTLSLSPAALQGTLFLPVVIVPAMVATIDENARMWSNPRLDAINLGPAGPRFTDLVVVAPQVRSRLLVFNHLTENYGWIEAASIGPA